MKYNNLKLTFKHQKSGRYEIVENEEGKKERVFVPNPIVTPNGESISCVSICNIIDIETNKSLGSGLSFTMNKEVLDKERRRKSCLQRALQISGFNKKTRTALWKAYFSRSEKYSKYIKEDSPRKVRTLEVAS